MSEMKFVYLIQGEFKCGSDLAAYLNTTADVITASYDVDSTVPNSRHLHIPGTTWAHGRNLLLEKARASGDYDYFIFLDDDLICAPDFASVFESALTRYQPDIGVPLVDAIRISGRFSPARRVQRPVGMDQIAQAYSRRAVEDAIAIPFVTDFDDESWWYSCEINQHLSIAAYPNSCKQFNYIRVGNGRNAMALPESMRKSSQYRGGVTAEGLELVRAYILEHFGDQDFYDGPLFRVRDCSLLGRARRNVNRLAFKVWN